MDISIYDVPSSARKAVLSDFTNQFNELKIGVAYLIKSKKDGLIIRMQTFEKQDIKKLMSAIDENRVFIDKNY